ncbi:MAG: DEAD/DEAH box helicase [Planctomycetota bacterium]
MRVTELVRQWLEARHEVPAELAAHHVQPPRVAEHGDYPDWVHPDLRAALEARGILEPYAHQVAAAQALHDGRHVVIATGTASGKSLCYHLPVIDQLLRDDHARALYLFPTKALARDQMGEVERLLTATGRTDLQVAVYDGDTPPAVRRALRDGGQLVLTNPHMLHGGILPNHTLWQGLFRGLRYVVVDEVHTLSGVYGSNVANVLRRLRRICRHYGSEPVFCAASATISNPGEHATRLLELPVEVVDRDGSPRGPKHFLFLNPALCSEVSGLRAPAVEVAREIAGGLLHSELQTISFARSRSTVEVLVKYLRDEADRRNVRQDRVAGYRGGYLPDLRRDIERGIRSGDVASVVTTSALELGIDIGSLDVCLLVGYPGTVASTFQRAGRVGRRQRESAVLLLARSFAMDQFLVHNPGYLFDQPREAVAIDPDNPIVLSSHLKCAAFELPFDVEEGFGEAESAREVLDFLADDARVLVREGGRYHYAGATYPAESVSLAAADLDNVVIMDRDTRHVLGEVDRPSSITEVFEGAIYGHQGEQYQVEQFDYDGRRAYVRRVDVDYYTEAESDTEVRVLHDDDVQTYPGYEAHLGEVHVATLAKAYKKVRFYTRENVGVGDIHLPPEELETEACMIVVDPELAERVGLGRAGDASGLRGVAELIVGLVPLFVRVDPGDVGMTAPLKNPHFERPTIILYDRVPGGVGLSARIFAVHREVLAAARGLLDRCACQRGCPACVGPSGGVSGRAKRVAAALLDGMLGEARPSGIGRPLAVPPEPPRS